VAWLATIRLRSGYCIQRVIAAEEADKWTVIFIEPRYLQSGPKFKFGKIDHLRETWKDAPNRLLA